MTTQDSTITHYGAVLTAPAGRVSAPTPFEVATRTYQGVTYTIVLNFSHQQQTYQGSTYAPYEIRITP
jgi:hypothetical protein